MTPRRFVTVEVDGKFYECARPYGARYIRVTVYRSARGEVEKVWIEADGVCPPFLTLENPPWPLGPA